MDRRLFVASAASLAFLRPVSATAQSRLAIAGELEQGSLVVVRTAAGAGASIDGHEVHVSADGIFAFGIAYDRTDKIAVKVNFTDGTVEERDVEPVRRQYDIQTIAGLPEKFVSPSAADLQRIAKEHEAIAQARNRDSASLGFATPFDWPARGVISGVFGSQRILNGKPMSPHFGVDIAAPAGTPITAPADGLVSLIGNYDLEGGFTLIDHGHGVSTCYLHQSKQLVDAGDSVRAGQKIGEIGMTGRATGPHLHWGMNLFQVKLDPSRSTRTPAPVRD